MTLSRMHSEQAGKMSEVSRALNAELSEELQPFGLEVVSFSMQSYDVHS